MDRGYPWLRNVSTRSWCAASASAHQWIADTLGYVTCPPDHGVRPALPHPWLQRQIEDPRQAGIDAGDGHHAPECVDLLAGGGMGRGEVTAGGHADEIEGRQSQRAAL